MNNLDDLLKELKTEKLEDIAPNFKQDKVSDEELEKIITIIATKFGIQRKYALVAFILLFLKGAASNNKLDDLSVEIKGTRISKKDIKMATQQILNNINLRKIAESLAIQIGKYAEENGLSGDLANRIDKLIEEEHFVIQPPLSPKERAWCSSFSRNIPDLDRYSSQRLVHYI